MRTLSLLRADELQYPHNRRQFLTAAAFLGCAAESAASPAIHGIFPILPTPYTVSKRLDRDGLASEAEVLNRCGVHGMVWPQQPCELSPEERMAGAAIVMETAKRPVILGVQGADIESTRRLARHAQKIGPCAVRAALTSRSAESVRHYRAIATECGLWLMAHAVSGVSIEFVLRLRDEINTLRLVEDSGGHTLSRISEYRRTAPELAVFTNGRGRTMPDELERGAFGVMPPARLSGSYVRIWNECLAGRREKAIAELTQIDVLLSKSA